MILPSRVAVGSVAHHRPANDGHCRDRLSVRICRTHCAKPLHAGHNNLPMLVEEDTPPVCNLDATATVSVASLLTRPGCLWPQWRSQLQGRPPQRVVSEGYQADGTLARQIIQTSVAGKSKQVEWVRPVRLGFPCGQGARGQLASCYDVSLGPVFGTAIFTQACLPSLFVDLARATRRRSLFERARADFHRRLSEGSAADSAVDATASVTEEQMGTLLSTMSRSCFMPQAPRRDRRFWATWAPAPASMLMELSVQHGKEDDFTRALISATRRWMCSFRASRSRLVGARATLTVAAIASCATRLVAATG